jgi:hypothetical protein
MCDTLVALGSATDVGATIFAKNSDRPPDEQQQIRWLPPRHDVGGLRVTHIEIEPHSDNTFGCLLTQPSWCWGAEHGVNTAGVAIGNEAIYTTLDPRSAEPALIGMDLVRLGLERGSSAAHAVEIIVGLLQRYGQGGACHDPAGVRAGVAYWSSFLVADPVSAFVIETSGSVVEVEQVALVRAISNRTTIPSFDAAHRHPRQPAERLVDPRWHASNEMLAARPVSVSAMRAHLSSHTSCAVDGWAVCMHAVEHGELVEVTASSMIATLVSDGPSIARVLLGHPCGEQYIEVLIGEPFTMG